jgi:putative transposase
MSGTFFLTWQVYRLFSAIMPRAKRVTLGGYVYHVLNRANGRLRIFRRFDDFAAFEQILSEGIERFGMRLRGCCIMSNHWHLVLWPVGRPGIAGVTKQ